MNTEKIGLHPFLKCLGTEGPNKTDDSSEKFHAEGRGVIFNPKIYVADFWNFKQGFLGIKLMKRISGFRVRFFNNCIDIN